MQRSNSFKALLTLTTVTIFLSWRAFDYLMVLVFISLIALRPMTKDDLKSALSELKALNFLIFAWIGVVFIGYQIFSMPLETLNFRWLLGLYLIYLAARQIKFNESSSFKYISILVILAIGISVLFDIQKTGALGPSNRLQGFYTNPNVFGLTATIGFAFTLAWIATLLNFRKRPFALEALALLSFAITIYFTYSRSAWMGCISAAILLVALFRKRAIFIRASFAITLISILMFSLNIFKFRERILDSANLSASSASTIRLQIWKANIQMFKEHPWFGVGYWQNTQLLPAYAQGVPEVDIHAHAHNQYLQVLSGTGIIGELIYISILLLGFYYFSKTYRSSKDIIIRQMSICALAVLVAYSVESLTDSPLDIRDTRNFLMLTIGTSLGIISSRKKLSRNNELSQASPQ